VRSPLLTDRRHIVLDGRRSPTTRTTRAARAWHAASKHGDRDAHDSQLARIGHETGRVAASSVDVLGGRSLLRGSRAVAMTVMRI